jgi:hypothetical protein
VEVVRAGCGCYVEVIQASGSCSRVFRAGGRTSRRMVKEADENEKRGYMGKKSLFTLAWCVCEQPSVEIYTPS